MGLPIRSKSIRGKLVFAFLLAIAPLLCVQALDELYEYKQAEQARVRYQQDIADSIARIISNHLEYLKRRKVVCAERLCKDDFSADAVASLCADSDRSLSRLATTRFEQTSEPTFPLLPARAGSALLNKRVTHKQQFGTFDIIVPVRFADNVSGNLITTFDSRELMLMIPEPETADEWQVYSVFDGDKRPFLAVDKDRGIINLNKIPAKTIESVFSGKQKIKNCAFCQHTCLVATATVPDTNWRVAVSRSLDAGAIYIGLRTVWLYATIISAAAGILVLFIMGNRLAKPIRKLAHAASAMAVGDYRKRVDIRTGDELETLGRAFNSMGEGLIQNDKSLREQAEMLAGVVEAARVAYTSLDMEQCGKAVARMMCMNLGAEDAAVYSRDIVDNELRPLAKSGRCNFDDWYRLAHHTFESGEYIVIPDDSPNTNGPSSTKSYLVGIPLKTAAKPFGVIVGRYVGTQKTDLLLGSTRADMLLAFALHASAALVNAETYSQAEKYSEVLTDWVEHLSSVMQVTDAISPSLDLDETLRALADTTASVLDADECAIYIPEKDGYLAVRASTEEFKSMEGKRVKPGESCSGLAFTQKRYAVNSDASANDEALSKELPEDSELRAILSTPLIVEDRAIGAISVYNREPRRFTPQEIRLLTSIGLHTAVIVRNAGLYTREASIAETLQRGLLPEIPETCSGLRFAGRYVPALDESRVGGDFFGVAELPNGRVGVFVGDVSGKGLGAAIHLATCKNMLKAFMHAYPDDPGKVLTQLNDTISFYNGAEFFVTLICGVIDPKSRVIRYANAGHPPGLLISQKGKMQMHMGSTGMPVGVGEYCAYDTQQLNASEGDILLMYTDGVTDALEGDGLLGDEQLQKILFQAGNKTASELIEYVCEKVNRERRSPHRDDVALLAVSFADMEMMQNNAGGSIVSNGDENRLEP